MALRCRIQRLCIPEYRQLRLAIARNTALKNEVTWYNALRHYDAKYDTAPRALAGQWHRRRAIQTATRTATCTCVTSTGTATGGTGTTTGLTTTGTAVTLR